MSRLCLHTCPCEHDSCTLTFVTYLRHGLCILLSVHTRATQANFTRCSRVSVRAAGGERSCCDPLQHAVHTREAGTPRRGRTGPTATPKRCRSASRLRCLNPPFQTPFQESRRKAADPGSRKWYRGPGGSLPCIVQLGNHSPQCCAQATLLHRNQTSGFHSSHSGTWKLCEDHPLSETRGPVLTARSCFGLLSVPMHSTRGMSNPTSSSRSRLPLHQQQ